MSASLISASWRNGIMPTSNSLIWRRLRTIIFYIEVLGGGNTLPTEVRPYTDLGDSLKYRGYHHFCLNVTNVEETVAKLRARGVVIVTEPFVLPPISRKLAFFADPFGNLIELAEVLP
jgi:glyoxylase I family protein